MRATMFTRTNPGWLHPARIADFIFGFDFFISYAHVDGLEYAARLADSLCDLGFRVFLDKRIYVAGDELEPATRRRIRMSRRLVVLATPGAFASTWVRDEIKLGLELGKPPIVIDVDQAIRDANVDLPVRRLLEARIYISEESGGPACPSYHVVTELQRSFNAMRQETIRLRCLSFATAAFAIIAIVAVWQYFVAVREFSRANRADCEQLLVAPPAAFKALANRLQPVSDTLRPHLAEMERSPSLNLEQRTRARLAFVRLAKTEHDRLLYKDALVEDLLNIKQPKESGLAFEVLAEARVPCSQDLWNHVATASDAGQRFQALFGLAQIDPLHSRWNANAAFVAQQILDSNVVDFTDLCVSFDQVAAALWEPLFTAYQDESHQDRMERSALILARHCRNEPEKLLLLIKTANGPQFRAIRDALVANSRFLLPRLRLLAGQFEPPDPPPSSGANSEAARQAIQSHYDRHAYERANAAIALMELDDVPRREKVWQLLRYTPDPSARTYLIHGLFSHGIQVSTLLDQYDASRLGHETPDIHRALLLAIGEYPLNQLNAAQLAKFVDCLLADFQDHPDPGVHSAAEWTLREWKLNGQLDAARRDLTGKPPGDRAWFVDSRQRSYALLSPRGTCMMGSPADEPDRSPKDVPEHPIQVTIPRTYAIATCPVTRGEFAEFLKAEKLPKVFDLTEEQRSKCPESDCPMLFVRWAVAAAYCNYLSRLDGLEPVYPSRILELLQMAKNVPRANIKEELSKETLGTMVPGYLDKDGYRLPTEAEWEFACRAGAVTARPFGRTDRMLDKYAYYPKNTNDKRCFPVGSLKPNDFGLFDMPGNVMQWCQWLTSREPFKSGAARSDTDDDLNAAPNDAVGEIRVLRGGAWLSRPSFHRCASRTAGTNWDVYDGYGFRVARTISSTTQGRTLGKDSPSR